ncbi:NAD-P-binding protein [Multifurca ochricompacta]|uniref:NAD-P-binding protein n=1 Tax=Multifurca ochricompacta TaxID=376703 RepID=A0AAD4QJP2_9AGAM|nr:NAD-P-binding protein [Multifurca ochricompacta]
MVSSTTRVWFITGASTGLGSALTRSVLARGDYVIATARSLRSFDELRQDPTIDKTRLKFLVLDVTSPMEEIVHVAEEALGIWGRIDVLVNNAGTLTYGASEELGAEGIMKDMKTNFVGPMNVTNAILPYMRSRRDGTIVFVGSRSAYRTQMIGVASYSSSKAALHSYGETLAAELEYFNIRVIIAVPGGFATKINAPKRSGRPLEGYEVVRDHMDNTVPKYVNIPKGDPALGMGALVDVVRGEGRAAGRGPPPLWLFLGEDSMLDVRARVEKLQSTLDEWKDVGSNLGLPVEQLSA